MRTDPMERLIEEALIESRTRYFAEDRAENVARLDFYLPDQDVYLEVKRLHSARISDQMARAENVIVAQGEAAVRALADLLRKG